MYTENYIVDVYDKETLVEESGKPYVALKHGAMLRSGVQVYAKSEIPQSLLSQVADKELYNVYRKPEAVVKALNMFNYLHLCDNHPTTDVTESNYKDLEVGKVGGNAQLKTLDDGNVYVVNDIIFDDRNAYNAYKAGKKELSIGMNCRWNVSDNPNYDFVVDDIVSVNHLALVDKARAGARACVLDSNSNIKEGYNMPDEKKAEEEVKKTDDSCEKAKEEQKSAEHYEKMHEKTGDPKYKEMAADEKKHSEMLKEECKDEKAEEKVENKAEEKCSDAMVAAIEKAVADAVAKAFDKLSNDINAVVEKKVTDSVTNDGKGAEVKGGVVDSAPSTRFSAEELINDAWHR